jgi:hypothetical protein
VQRVAPDPAAVGTQGARTRAPSGSSRWPVGARAWAAAVVTGSELVMAHGPSTLRRRASAWEQPATRSSTSPSTA